MLKLIVILAAVAVCYGQANGRIYRLFTKGNNISQNMTINDSGLPATFVPENDTIILIHGHRGGVNAPFNRDIIREIHDIKKERNIIVVDWETEASFEYSVASSYVRRVADDLASFLRWLTVQTSIIGSDTATRENGNSTTTPLLLIEKLHLVGFGLGAHIAGIASRQLRDSPGLVGRITGLDPSGSGWGSRGPRLTAGDALYVEVIHTDGLGPLANGVGTEIGDIDFFANGGSNQPGCFSHSCSHERAWELFAASLRGHLFGYRCSSKVQLNLNLCRGNRLELGGLDVYKEARYGEIYRVNTRRNFPF